MISKIVIFLIIATLTVVYCLPAAKVSSDDPQVICKLPMVKGYCRALLPRWRYDASIGKCVEFKYGGCNGNANNFMSYKTCMAACEGVS